MEIDKQASNSEATRYTVSIPGGASHYIQFEIRYRNGDLWDVTLRKYLGEYEELTFQAKWIEALKAVLRAGLEELEEEETRGRICNDDRIFSGPNSAALWHDVCEADTIETLQDALYRVCCGLQRLENQVQMLEDEGET